MENPFLKRATEYLRDEEAFLAIVSPEPVKHFLSRPGKNGLLYDRLVYVRGTPGSGKTTLARLFEYPTLAALLRNRNIYAHRALVAALVDCKAIIDEAPVVVGCRLAMETDYRDFWEFPYSDELKLSLMNTLIQARAVLNWINNLVSAGVEVESIRIIPRQNSEIAVETIGGTGAAPLLARARAVELSIYKVIGALVAPDVSELDSDCTGAYHPFDIIESFHIQTGSAENERTIELRPLVILDDAHLLHPKQFEGLERWLIRRELRVARWILTRLDVLYPHEALSKITEDRTETIQLPGITATRDTTEIMLQSGATDRRGQRTAFRKMAKDMANRYLRKMPLFASRDLVNLSDLLSTVPESVPVSKRRELENSITTTQNKLAISDSRREVLKKLIESYKPGNKSVPADVHLAMLGILMNRYAKRTPQRNLFQQELDPDPPKQLTADSTVYDAARIYLLHKYSRPYYTGIDDLCDAGSENAEQFLRLAAVLVDAVAARLIHSKQPSLDTSTQHKLLRRSAEEIIETWNFPQYQLVRTVVNHIAERCLAVSLEPNAWLGAGANAYGIVQNEFDEIPAKYSDLARVLQFAIAYNAFTVVPRYECKGQKWCLLELGGMVILKHGLTLKRGGFLEGTAEDLNSLIQEAEQ